MENRFESAFSYLMDWLRANVLTWNTTAQWACIGIIFLATALIWRNVEKRLFGWVEENISSAMGRSSLRALIDIGNVAAFIILIQICAAIFQFMEFTPRLLDAASNLAVAWIAIRLLTSIMPNRALARAMASIIWTVAALGIFDLLTPITDFLRSLSISMGESSFTALGAIKGLILAAICLQVASLTTQFADKRIDGVKDLSPSLQVLLKKATKVCLFTAAILFAMTSVGIDLTSLAIFSSALGVGIGFGLKTVFSNYVAGILLLMDNSIKPGDTIEVGGVFGVVREMHGRYASIKTRDGKEYLVPNEQLISGEVINWTFSDTNVRIKIPVGIAYDSDVNKAMKLLEQAAKDVPRVLRHPGPAARLTGFGDNAVDLQLRIWIKDSEDGVANVRSQVLLKVWDIFHEQGIEFPFPQRDILLKPESALTVRIDKEETS